VHTKSGIAPAFISSLVKLEQFENVMCQNHEDNVENPNDVPAKD